MAHARVEALITAHGGNELQSVRLFDRYDGDQVPEGKISLAYALLFRAVDRTLTDDEVDEHMEKIVAALAQECCHLR